MREKLFLLSSNGATHQQDLGAKMMEKMKMDERGRREESIDER